MSFLKSLKSAFSGFSMGGNARYYHDALGLEAEEDFRTISVGQLWQTPNASAHREAAALAVVGLFTGHTVEVATSIQATSAITTTGRLVIGMIPGQDQPFSFAPASGYNLVLLEELPEEKIMGPTGAYEDARFLSLQSQGQEMFRLVIGLSKANDFVNWR